MGFGEKEGGDGACYNYTAMHSFLFSHHTVMTLFTVVAACSDHHVSLPLKLDTRNSIPSHSEHAAQKRILKAPPKMQISM